MPSITQTVLFPEAATAPVGGECAGEGGHAPLFRSLQPVHDLLLAWHGQPKPREVWDPLTQLIYSLCSSRTKDAEIQATLRTLRERFNGWPDGPDSWNEVHWEQLRDASLDAIEDALRLATFPDRKAVQLKQTLERITARAGVLSLQWLSNYRTDKIRAWIESLPGAGVKASAAVVNFSSLRRAAMAIDGHHQRIAIRLGVVPGNASARQVEQALMRLVPPHWTPVTLDEHHTLVKKLGQRLCPLREPQCSRCPLRAICVTGSGASPSAQDACGGAKVPVPPGEPVSPEV